MALPRSGPVATLAGHPLIWRGGQPLHRARTLGTGYAALDRALPGQGWPLGAVTELVHDRAGCGEFSLLLPALARLARESHWITMIDPPWIPCPSTLHDRGLALDRLLLIHTRSRDESLWACEQAVRGIRGGAVLAWPATVSFAELRRLQLAAESTLKTVFLFRGRKAASASSPAALRLRLTADDGNLQVRVLKCRGRRPAAAVRLEKPPGAFFWHQFPAGHAAAGCAAPLAQPLMPPRVSPSGSSKRSSSPSESPVFSLATSSSGRFCS